MKQLIVIASLLMSFSAAADTALVFDCTPQDVDKFCLINQGAAQNHIGVCSWPEGFVMPACSLVEDCAKNPDVTTGANCIRGGREIGRCKFEGRSVPVCGKP